MTKQLLSDKDQFPSEEIIFSHLGDSRLLWTNLFESTHTRYPEFSEEWRYYNDGKRWLMKVLKQTKTIFWLSVIEEAFIITFYFSDKAETAILESKLSDELKKSFQNGKRFGKIRGISVQLKHQSDVDYILELVAIKLRIK